VIADVAASFHVTIHVELQRKLTAVNASTLEKSKDAEAFERRGAS
jgi:hypothetical protein